MDNTNLTPEELEFVNGIKAEMEFFERYKRYIAEVQKIFIKQGAKAARAYIRATADKILLIASDEMIHKLLTKL